MDLCPPPRGGDSGRSNPGARFLREQAPARRLRPDLRAEKAIRAETEEANERIRVKFDSAPLGWTMTDPDFQSIDCNNEILRMHGLENKEGYCNRFFELAPEYQPCARKSADLAARHLHKAFSEGFDRFEWLHYTADGQHLPVEITIIRVMVGHKPRVAGYVHDLRDPKKPRKPWTNKSSPLWIFSASRLRKKTWLSSAA